MLKTKLLRIRPVALIVIGIVTTVGSLIVLDCTEQTVTLAITFATLCIGSTVAAWGALRMHMAGDKR